MQLRELIATPHKDLQSICKLIQFRHYQLNGKQIISEAKMSSCELTAKPVHKRCQTIDKESNFAIVVDLNTPPFKKRNRSLS
jgi:hypothetical protein